MEEILYIGISQTLFAGILIAVKKPRIYANQILAAWLFIICIEMIIVLLNDYTCGALLRQNSPIYLWSPVTSLRQIYDHRKATF